MSRLNSDRRTLGVAKLPPSRSRAESTSRTMLERTLLGVLPAVRRVAMGARSFELHRQVEAKPRKLEYQACSQVVPC